MPQSARLSRGRRVRTVTCQLLQLIAGERPVAVTFSPPVSLIARATPKSVTTACPSSSRMLPGLVSRWISVRENEFGGEGSVEGHQDTSNGHHLPHSLTPGGVNRHRSTDRRPFRTILASLDFSHHSEGEGALRSHRGTGGSIPARPDRSHGLRGRANLTVVFRRACVPPPDVTRHLVLRRQ